MRTVDPLVIEYIIKTNVHWVALKRFFLGKDSIFNNSKNALLCKITKELFRKLEFFPVERKQDNEKCNNIQSLKNMSLFLQNGYSVGIFPEGTTRKYHNEFFGNFDPLFVKLAKRNNAVIQPILICWTDGKHRRPIVNFGNIIKTDSQDVEDIFDQYMKIQKDLFSENMTLIEKKISVL